MQYTLLVEDVRSVTPRGLLACIHDREPGALAYYSTSNGLYTRRVSPTTLVDEVLLVPITYNGLQYGPILFTSRPFRMGILLEKLLQIFDPVAITIYATISYSRRMPHLPYAPGPSSEPLIGQLRPLPVTANEETLLR